MTLTPDDLNAIRDLIIITVQPMITEALDEQNIMIAAAFAEVHAKFDASIDAHDRWLKELAAQSEFHTNQIGHIRGQLHAA